MVSPLFPNMMSPGMGGMGNPNRGPNIDKLQRKYGMFNAGAPSQYQPSPYQPGFPMRDIGVGGNPYGGGPKTMDPAATPMINGYTDPSFTPYTVPNLTADGKPNPFAGILMSPTNVSYSPTQTGMMGMGQAATQMPDWFQNYAQQLSGQTAQPMSPYTPGSISLQSLAVQGNKTLNAGQPQMGMDQAYNDFLAQQSYAPNVMGDALGKMGMGGANPYTINQAATLANPVGQMQPQKPVRPDDGMMQQRDPRQPQMRTPQQGGQMANAAFAVR